MKLMELLEQGKKATRDNFEKECKVKFLFVDKEKKDMIMSFRSDGKIEGSLLTIRAFTRDDWFEYIEEPKYKTNFEFNQYEYDVYKLIDDRGKVEFNHWDNVETDMAYLNNFNAFPTMELAEFIKKKQLLERKLIIFSYLNGADEIKWSDRSEKHNIIAFIDTSSGSIDFDKDSWRDINSINDIYFKDKDTCKAAYNLYKDEIAEVLKLKVKFGF